ncbi:MAG: excinuclease ABC subunit UvrC [Gammaproteobacteria bacterium]|nr:excinuclease ABC subunit UvrC [Gammaproteobacteria bacterium]
MIPQTSFDYQSFIKNLTALPGIYQMMNAGGEVIYVGKAKNLKKRVSSYFQKTDHSPKTKVMVKQIDQIEIIITESENEALILENQLIKKYLPRYNVIFRDDKSYPFIFLSDESYPRLTIHRGKQNKKGEYFGPFTGSSAARYSISLMQKLFQIRQCEDSVFKYRTRPCLQYQIKRCSGSCVGKITESDYHKDVNLVRLFYQGKNDTVIELLSERMQQASDELNFEQAANIRDQIIQLRKVLEKQVVNVKDGEIDIVVGDTVQKVTAIFMLQIRNGMVQGNRSFYPKVPSGTDIEEVLEAFIEQYYFGINRNMPKEIITNHPLSNETTIAKLLSENLNHKIRITSKVKTNRAAWLEMANSNLMAMLQSKLASKAQVQKRLYQLQHDLDLDKLPMRMECFDISHTMGEKTVASCVVFENGESKKSDYRRFNIKGITAGDDYAAIEQAVERRFKRLVAEEAKLPDLLIIDGGKGQLNQAQKVLENLNLDNITLISVAKGTDRKAGLEQIFFPNEAIGIRLSPDSLGLHLIQQIRDEAHRFAITGHRTQRDKKRKVSLLEGIPGVGAKRRRAIIQHFGGIQGVKSASVAELQKVEGLSKSMAQTIYDYLR